MYLPNAKFQSVTSFDIIYLRRNTFIASFVLCRLWWGKKG